MFRSLAASLRTAVSIVSVSALAGVGLATGPAGATHDPTQFVDLTAPFTCGSEWVGGTRAGHGENNWNLDINRTSLVWPDRQHDMGQPLYAQGPGVVAWVGLHVNAGTYLDIDYGDYTVRYVHLVHDSIPPGVHQVGDVVASGQLIGLVGDTGNAEGFAHLHLEYWDSREMTDAAGWRLRNAGYHQTEVTFDGNVIDPGEVFVSTNCVGDALDGRIPTQLPDDPLLAEVARLADPLTGRDRIVERLAAFAAPSTGGTDPAEFLHPTDPATHVIGVIAGTDLAAETLLLTATDPDGTAAVLAAAEALATEGPRRTVVVAAFDGADTIGTWAAGSGAPILASTVGVIHAGSLGESAHLRFRDDSLIAHTGSWAGTDGLLASLDRRAGLRWHSLVGGALTGPAAAPLVALGLPTLVFTDVPGACGSDAAAELDPRKLGVQIDDLTAVARSVAQADTPPSVPTAEPVAAAADPVPADPASADPVPADPDAAVLRRLATQAGLADPDTLAGEDASALDARIRAAFADGVCAAPDLPAPFVDVAAGSYALADVALLYDLGITTGTAADRYSPADEVTREQMGAFLGRVWRVFHPDAVPTIESPFTDVDPTSYAFDDIRLLLELQVTTGTSNTTYDPGGVVTRVQMAAFLGRLWRALHPEFETGTVPMHSFADVPETSYATDDISLIASLGITTGTSKTTYSPDDPVTREQMAAFLGRLLRAADALRLAPR